VSISGTAGADLGLQGRGFSMPDLTQSLEGTGHMAVKDGKIEGVNLLQEAIAILKVVGLSLDDAKATAFSTIETDLAIKQGIVHVQRLLMDSHDFQATGGGTIGFDQTLNLAVNLNLSQDFSQKLGRSSPVAKLAMKEGRLSLPLVITGTAQAPSYGLNMKGLTGKVQEQVREKAEEAVGGLLKGTTKPEDVKQQGQEMLKGLLGR
jgi:AsmA protein